MIHECGNELAPFHNGHKMAGALVWATSQFFDDERWADAGLPGVDRNHRPLPQFMRMADDHLWVVMRAMLDGLPGKVRVCRGSGRLWHYFRTAAVCIAPAVSPKFGSTDEDSDGSSQATAQGFASALGDIESWGGAARVLDVVELACGRFSRSPDVSSLLGALDSCEPGSDAWDVELADAVAKVLSMDGIESHDALMRREKRRGAFTPLRDQWVDHISLAVNRRVDALLGSYMKVIDIDTGASLKEAM